jgi:DNA-binding MarR family transcriptional regulator
VTRKLAVNTPATAGPRKTPSAPATDVVEQFRTVFLSVKDRVEQGRTQAGLTSSQALALSSVNDDPGIGVSQLARQLGLHQSTTSNLLGPLIAEGLLDSSPREDDARGVHLRVTAAGKRVLRRVPDAFDGLLTQALEQLDGTTRRRLGQDLQALAQVLEACALPRGRATPSR